MKSHNFLWDLVVGLAIGALFGGAIFLLISAGYPISSFVPFLVVSYIPAVVLHELAHA